MLKKLIIIGIIAVIAIVISSSIILISNIDQNSEESEVIVQGDVIMPTKVSRPGCDETNRCYIPSVFVIDSGKQVTWVNEDSAFHSVTSGFYDEPTDLFDSGHLDPFESFTFEFDKPGTYDYFCTLHPWMEGQVIVEN